MPSLPNNLSWQLHQFNGQCTPLPTDDSSKGFSFGSFWFDLQCNRIYMCLVSTEGAAIWRRISTGLDDALLTVDGDLILAQEELVYT